MSTFHRLKPRPGATHRMKRVGRGPGSGIGKQSGRGHKGQKARGPGARPGFEGGQMPIIRMMPKRGFTFMSRPGFQVVNVGRLETVDAKDWIDPVVLYEKRLVRQKGVPVKVLGDGDIKSAIQIKAHAFSRSARKKIEKAGGKVELIANGKSEIQSTKSENRNKVK